MNPTRSALYRTTLDLLAAMATRMTGADCFRATMLAGIAMDCARDGIDGTMIVYRAMYIAQREGHTALLGNAERMVATANAAERILRVAR